MDQKTSQKTLVSETFRWLENMKTLKMPGRPPRKGAERTRLHQIRQDAKEKIAYLAKLAELLPEDQLNQVFTIEHLFPLFDAIFNLVEKPPIDEELLEKKRKRLLPLCYETITLLDEPGFSEQLAGPLRTVTATEGGLLPGLRAIYYRSMVPQKKKAKGKVRSGL